MIRNSFGTPLGVCQVAVVQLVAVRTCQVVGAVALLTFISVVALFNRLAVSILVLQVIVLFVSVSVLDIEGITTHSTAITQALTLLRVVSEVCQSSIVPVVETPVTPQSDVLGEFIVVVPPFDDPILILEVEPTAPPVHKFTVLVVAVAVALAE